MVYLVYGIPDLIYFFDNSITFFLGFNLTLPKKTQKNNYFPIFQLQKTLKILMNNNISNNNNFNSLLNKINQYSKITKIDFENDSISLSNSILKKNNTIPETLEINKI